MVSLPLFWSAKIVLLQKSPRHIANVLGRFHSGLRNPGLRQIQVPLRTLSKMTAAPEARPPANGNAIVRFWNGYLRFTDAYPLRTQGLTAVIFAGLGNFISQTVVEKRSLRTLDWNSIIKFMVIGGTVTFPIIRSWFWTLERIVKPSRFAAVKKVLIDQLLFAPVFLASFILLMGCVEGTGWEDAKERLSHDWVNVMMSNYQLWPAAQFINFYFVPFNQRILFGSLVSLGWNVYLAFVVRQGTGGSRGIPKA
ncbi:putative Protein Mpv17 [Hypsibius exemplaris]|uniref:Mitochondrial inner membrane protein Mpv17 n=1 Tax=Hypsibius exemplaris TaxID=2072580 RepID=A0A1W0XCD7_HYPEX|nr:putative Protein Mpv17 [Hypsibius exemplaris]